MTDIPDDVRSRGVASDDRLLSEEKELTIVCPNDDDRCIIYSNITTFIKWMQSVEESRFEDVHMNESGQIVGAKANIPKGIMKLKGSARKSNNHSDIVSYGNERGKDK